MSEFLAENVHFKKEGVETVRDEVVYGYSMGGSLTPNEWIRLLATLEDMMRCQKAEARIRVGKLFGTITTDFKHGELHGFQGRHFSAHFQKEGIGFGVLLLFNYVEYWSPSIDEQFELLGASSLVP